ASSAFIRGSPNDVIDTAGRSRPRSREPLAAPKHGRISNVPRTYDRRSIGSHALSRRVRAAQIRIDHRMCGVGVDICRAADLDVEAQSGVVGHGQTGPGKRIPFKAQRERPQLTPEKKRLQEESLRHPYPGPPEPEAPASQTPAGAPTQPPTELLPIGGTFTIFQQTAQPPYPGASTSFVAETQAATNGPIVFYSANWFASFSTDGGASFTFVDPYTQFDPLDGGFCCDQTVTYDPTRDLMIWQLQYLWSPSTNKGSYLLAF